MDEATFEFLDENARRRYPLAQGCLPAVLVDADLDAPTLWPDDVLLDLRGFYRGNPHGEPVYLAAWSGAASAAAPPFAPGANGSLFFTLGGRVTPTILRFDLPAAPLVFPLRLRAALPDPNVDANFAYTGSSLGALELTLGAGTLDLPATAAWTFGANAPLEPGTVFQLHGGQVDQLGGLPVDLPGFLVGGDVRFTGGYSVDVRTDVVGGVPVVQLDARVGGGTLGRLENTAGDADCAGGALLSLNGLGPDGRGRFYLRGGPGVRVDNFPAAHRITVTLDVSAFGGAACLPD